MAEHVRKLGVNKGMGPDAIPAEVIKSGGVVFVRFLTDMIQAMCRLYYVAKDWRGGRMLNLYKGKGDIELTDASRGLLLADHSSKVFVGILRDHVEDAYIGHVPQTQFGCVKGRGTEVASHLVRSILDYARLRTLSVYILFLDLSTAFDRAIREILLGWRAEYECDKSSSLSQWGSPMTMPL